MGRYYYMQKFEGKWGFGIQSSDDPEYYGCEELEPDPDYENDGFLEYYVECTHQNINRIRKRLHRNYNILRVPQRDRIETVKDNNELYDFLDAYVDKHLYSEEEPETGGMRYAIDSETARKLGFSSNEVWSTGEKSLAYHRIVLGIRILSELKEFGHCYISSEC